jgi:hypothetical protein
VSTAEEPSEVAPRPRQPALARSAGVLVASYAVPAMAWLSLAARGHGWSLRRFAAAHLGPFAGDDDLSSLQLGLLGAMGSLVAGCIVVPSWRWVALGVPTIWWWLVIGGLLTAP